jgi:hypothetical protein
MSSTQDLLKQIRRRRDAHRNHIHGGLALRAGDGAKKERRHHPRSTQTRSDAGVPIRPKSDGSAAADAPAKLGGPWGRWAGDTAVIIASGPSLKKADVDYVRGKAKVIAINTSFRIAPWAEILYACDAGWWHHYFGEVARLFQGSELWTISIPAYKKYKLHYIYGDDKRSGLSKTPQQLNAGKNSAHQAIGLAYLFGAKRILLLGCDFQRVAGKVHWHADHPRAMGNGGRFAEWVKDMRPLAQDLRAAGVEVINCSPSSAIDAFPKHPIQECL